MSFIDLLVIIFYFGLLMAIGAVVSRKVKTNEDAVIGGKSFGVLAAAVGKTANLAGGPAVVGGTGYGYSFGFGGSWFGIANIISSWISAPFAPRIWKAMTRGHLVSIGGYLGYRFGKFARVFSGLTNALAYTGFVAAQIVATGKILHVLLGWSLNTAMIVTTGIVIFYTILGGLKAVVYTDFLQLGIMLGGFFAVLMPMSISTIGGWGDLMAKVPEIYHNWGSMGWGHIIGSILIPTALAGFTMQASYAFIGSAKSMQVSWTSSILSGVLYGLLYAAVIIIGMAAFLLYPGIDNQDALGKIILELLPHGLIGLLLAAVLSATMSTAATCSLSAATNFGEDVIKPLFEETYSKQDPLKMTRILIGIVGIVALAFSIVYPQIIGLLLMGYSLGAGGLLIPVFAAMFWKRANAPGCIAAMLGGGISYLVLSNIVTWPPLFASIPISLVLLVVVSLMTPAPPKNMYDIYFDDEWDGETAV